MTKQTEIYALSVDAKTIKATRRNKKPLINKTVTKYGITTNLKQRIEDIQRESGQKLSVLYHAPVPNALEVEQKIHKTHAKDNVFFAKDFSGHTEYFDHNKSQINSVISTIQQASGQPRNYGTIAPQYNEEYEPANTFYIILTIVAVLLFFLLPLLFKF